MQEHSFYLKKLLHECTVNCSLCMANLLKQAAKHMCKFFFISVMFILWRVYIILFINIWTCCFWIPKLLYFGFQILFSAEVVARLSHDQVAFVALSKICILVFKFYFLPKLLLGWVTTRSLSLRRFVALSKIVQDRLSTTPPPG